MDSCDITALACYFYHLPLYVGTNSCASSTVVPLVSGTNNTAYTMPRKEKTPNKKKVSSGPILFKSV